MGNHDIECPDREAYSSTPWFDIWTKICPDFEAVRQSSVRILNLIGNLDTETYGK